MKINDLTSLGNLVRSGALPEPRSPQSGAPNFRVTLEGIHAQNAEQMLSELRTRVNQQGDALGRRVDIVELKRFRELVTTYVGEAVRFMYEFKKQSTFDARGRHRLYAIIKRINETLEQMTREVLDEQADTIELMGAIDEIRGMLIDILL